MTVGSFLVQDSDLSLSNSSAGDRIQVLAVFSDGVSPIKLNTVAQTLPSERSRHSRDRVSSQVRAPKINQLSPVSSWSD
jgi:hypothetical protein